MSFKEVNNRLLKKVSKMATERDNLFDFEEEVQSFANSKNLPVSLLKEIEIELSDRLLHSGQAADQTDVPLNFIQNIVQNIKLKIENFVEDREIAVFLQILSKIFAILLSVKADTPEKIINIVRIAVSTVLKSGQNQVSSKKSKNL